MKNNRTALLLALMMVLVPALGSPTEELLQDTLKSILVSFFVLTATLVYLRETRTGAVPMPAHVHGVLLFPLVLMAYALGSMVWSHTYLAGVEVCRWFVLALIVFLGVNTLTHERVTTLAWGIHIGAVIASLWTALQFWGDFSLFSQGPNPASTFVNRNFFAEYLVCTLPFSVLLLTRQRDKTTVFLLAFSLAFNLVAQGMAATRSALTGLVLLLPSLGVALWVFRGQIASTGWRRPHRIALLCMFIATVLLLGSIPTNNAQIISQTGPGNALDRSQARVASIAAPTEYTTGAFSLRLVMWKTTVRMIADNPWAGVGAGAWEVATPRYQETGSQLETDFYAHNEFLQLLAEFGLTGWIVLLSLLVYLLWAAWRTWALRSATQVGEALPRSMALCSILMMLWVSNAGFPWHMATTGALLALSLAVIGASDIRLGIRPFTGVIPLAWGPAAHRLLLGLTVALGGLAVVISQRAIECESKLIRAVKIGMTINGSGTVADTRWDSAKAEMLHLVREGIEINPHYRKVTPIVADILAGWGDWKNALWIWESVLASRPYVFALMANVARGQIQLGNHIQAQETLDRARGLRPVENVVDALQVMLWSRSGKEPEAAVLAKKLIRQGTFDPDLVRASYYLGMRTRDPELAIRALELRIQNWPEQAVEGWIMLGAIYVTPEFRDEEKAIASYRKAFVAAPANLKDAVLARVPPKYHAAVRAP